MSIDKSIIARTIEGIDKVLLELPERERKGVEYIIEEDIRSYGLYEFLFGEQGEYYVFLDKLDERYCGYIREQNAKMPTWAREKHHQKGVWYCMTSDEKTRAKNIVPTLTLHIDYHEDGATKKLNKAQAKSALIAMMAELRKLLE
jgi:hypothetical protein